MVLYCFNISGNVSNYSVLPRTVTCFHILVLMVLFHRSPTDEFSSFSCEYICTAFFSKRPLRYLLLNSLPLSTHRYCGFLPSLSLLKASLTVSPFLSLSGSIQPYFLNTSRTMRRCRYPLFHLLNFCISTRSAHQIPST